MKPIVTVTNIFPQAALDKLAPECDLKTNDSGVSSTAEELGRMVSESDAVISYLTDKIGRDIIDQSTKLKIIANYGAGFNNIDVNYASERGIWVTNTPSVLHETTADLTWAMILGAARRIVPADRFTREGKFKGWSAKMFLGGDVYGKTLGVIGCGEIGRSVVRRASGFNMRVLYHQRNRLPEEEERMLNAEFISLDQLLRESDFITLHVPLTDETEYMIGNDEIALMKKTAYLIHTARGKVIDDYALVAALKEGRLAGAALDVYEDEPELTEGMTELDNLLLLPHIGSASFETRDRMALLVADNVLDALVGKTPRTLVPSYPK
ncbi:MAG TPA: D-glycerate dehydrogenase [Nitrospinaceae bacterium]|jgi:glyoxylate reductase|nr:D-glycerate dehydrogenase [Nitrospinota bacterium]MDP6336055.1 D-glycerate dehydrogenase [Nitrospinaceae bacterium]MDP7148643.1 D-glycerate dehydrogenase [Nitrospinaceae bacterium]HAX45377.1 D-glycerate dehydrogenase [Nitrospina sp.]HJO57981.1 D-glycerate dehydrogenase [Nitrospinaceae bacterium]|tara:strand:- start:284 stop:1255 length:972 start_codon:yes stop_codon:yes gene_type:complete